MWGTRQGVATILLGLLAAVAWWLLESQPEQAEVPVTRSRAPDYLASDIDAVQTGEDGRPSRRLVAREMRQYVDEDLVELDLPRLTVMQVDSPPWNAESLRGLLLSGGEEVRLLDDVRLHRRAAPGRRGVLLTTDALTIWPEREYAQGDRPVRIDSDLDWVTGEGIRIWYSKPAHTEIGGRAHIYIAPDAAPDAKKPDAKKKEPESEPQP